MRLLGVDVGTRRIGLALSDASATLATPLRVQTVSGGVDRSVAVVTREITALQGQADGLAGVVVGVPTALDGQPHDQTRAVLRFIERLRVQTAIPVYSQDERLTSVEAESRLARRDKNWRRRKSRLDAAAAAVILQDYLDQRARPTGVDSQRNL